MKKAFLLLFACFSLVAASAQQQQPQQAQSRLVNLEKLYKFTPAQKLVLDSICHPVLSSVDILPSTLKKVTIADSLYMTQSIVPIKAEIVTDSLGGYNEVIIYQVVTSVQSEKHAPGSVKVYNEKLKAKKAEIAARLRQQATEIEKQE